MTVEANAGGSLKGVVEVKAEMQESPRELLKATPKLNSHKETGTEGRTPRNGNRNVEV